MASRSEPALAQAGVSTYTLHIATERGSHVARTLHSTHDHFHRYAPGMPIRVRCGRPEHGRCDAERRCRSAIRFFTRLRGERRLRSIYGEFCGNVRWNVVEEEHRRRYADGERNRVADRADAGGNGFGLWLPNADPIPVRNRTVRLPRHRFGCRGKRRTNRWCVDRRRSVRRSHRTGRDRRMAGWRLHAALLAYHSAALRRRRKHAGGPRLRRSGQCRYVRTRFRCFLARIGLFGRSPGTRHRDRVAWNRVSTYYASPQPLGR